MDHKLYRGLIEDFAGPGYLGMFPKQYNSDKKIIITTDGKTTKASFYDGKKLVKEASTRCHPDDKFEFEVGAKVAFNRLIAKQEALKYYTGKIICVESASSDFTKGKIYQVRDGYVIQNDGIPSTRPYVNLQHINTNFCSKFIELVED